MDNAGNRFPIVISDGDDIAIVANRNELFLERMSLVGSLGEQTPAIVEFEFAIGISDA